MHQHCEINQFRFKPQGSMLLVQLLVYLGGNHGVTQSVDQGASHTKAMV